MVVAAPEAEEALAARHARRAATARRSSGGMKLPNIKVPQLGQRTKGINGFTVALAFGGAVLLYSGVKGYGISQTIQDLIAGRQPSNDPVNRAAARTANGVNRARNRVRRRTGRPAFPGPGGRGPGLPPHTGGAPITTSFRRPRHGGPTPNYNRRLGRMLAASYGWSTGDNWTSLLEMWNQESGWNQYAKNARSGAYGIAQALPETKYPPAGRESGGSSPYAQIEWGLRYIKQRYGSPHNAWRNHYWQQGGWY